jgi:radical SAM superfamily enzyme YgiQ (UPF0313 family)
MSETKKVILTQPNYSVFGKRMWGMIPYSLGIINACLRKDFKSDIFDPNFKELDDEKIVNYFKKESPDFVGISTVSTEYVRETEHMAGLIRKALPDAKIIVGGIVPTVSLKEGMQDRNVDYWFIGEAEQRVADFLKELGKDKPNLSQIEGIAYYERGEPRINRFQKESSLVRDLDSVPFPDYGNLDIRDYGNTVIKYSAQMVPQKYPFAITSTSRGCPFNCTFCSGWTVVGKKVRMRSANNVLREIDELYSEGIREVIFLDDHFLFNKKRAEDIMNGLIQRKYDLSWKVVNLNLSNLDKGTLDLMRRSGSYQITISIESGNETVLKEMIKKPFIDLKEAPAIVKRAKNMGFQIISNFMIGYPEETWEQIRDTFRYAEKLDVDYSIFHIATPLPGTELMKMCLEKGVLKSEVKQSGFCQPLIETKEFTIPELRILRAFEWDRINFSSEEKRREIAKMQGVSMEELEQWRKDTRRKLGVNIV